jgi:hypothetical protein
VVIAPHGFASASIIPNLVPIVVAMTVVAMTVIAVMVIGVIAVMIVVMPVVIGRGRVWHERAEKEA